MAFAAFSLRLSDSDPSDTSPYGYGRIAFLSAGFEGGMISIAAIWIIVLSVQKLMAGAVLDQLRAGPLLTLGASLINLGLGL